MKPKLALIPSGYKQDKVYSVLPNNGDGDFTFKRTSSATRINKDGVIETVASDVPRLDYSDSNCPVLLLEPTRTNLYLNSDTLVTQDVTTSAEEYTVSFYGTGSLEFTGTYTGELAGTGYNEKVTLTFTATAGTLTTTVTGDVRNAQIELGDYPTSYIPTTSTAVTRVKDICNDGGDIDVFSGNEGSLFIDAVNFATPSSSFSPITLSDGTTNNLISFFYEEDTIGISVRLNSAFIYDYNITSVTANQRNKTLLTYKDNEFKVYFNGELKDTGTSGTAPSGMFKLNFASINGTTNNFEGKIYDTRFYNTVLTEEEAIQLTII
jgi:hypothetical protein